MYAVDVSSMFETAREIAKVNGFGDRIAFIRGRVEEADLPKVDIILNGILLAQQNESGLRA